MSKRKLNSSKFIFDNGFVYGWYGVELSLVAFLVLGEWLIMLFEGCSLGKFYQKSVHDNVQQIQGAIRPSFFFETEKMKICSKSQCFVMFTCVHYYFLIFDWLCLLFANPRCTSPSVIL